MPRSGAIAAIALVLLAACGARSPAVREPVGPPPVARFDALIEADPAAAAPLAHAVLRSPSTDEATRRRVLLRWTQAVPALEALRDARLADAEALLAQGAVAAAAEAVHEAAELESAVGLGGSPRDAAALGRDVELARQAAEATAREAGHRARGAWRAGDAPGTAEAAAEARLLRHRAGLTADVNLAVLEGLARRTLEAVAAAQASAEAPHVPIAPGVKAPPRVVKRRAAPVRAESPAPPTRVAPADPLAFARHAWRTDDVAGAANAVAAARAGGASGPELEALAGQIEARRRALVERHLADAEAAYVREDLETARAHWERVLALAPDHPRAREGLSLYRRFLALQAP